MIRVVSLFSGIGGFEYGLKAAGIEHKVKMACEIDSTTRTFYKALHGVYPEGDIKALDEWDVPDHDLLIGGFPCQSFSIAGKRLGFVDTRGTLFFEIERILKAKQPKFVLLENVKGLLNHEKGATFEVILEKLSGLGYAVDFALLNSKHFDVAQNRERVYIVAILGEAEERWQTGTKSGVDNHKKALAKNSSIRPFNFAFSTSEAVGANVADILEDNADPKYIMKQGMIPVSSDNRKKTDLKMVGKMDMKGNDTIKRVYSIDGICPTLTTMEGCDRQPKFLIGEQVRKLTPLECFRVQGFPDGAETKLRSLKASDSRLYKAIGNSVTPAVPASMFSEMKKRFEEFR